MSSLYILEIRPLSDVSLANMFSHTVGSLCILMLFSLALQGSGEGIVGRGFYRSYYKGHKDKIKGEGRGGGGRWDWLGWGGGMGRKGIQL